MQPMTNEQIQKFNEQAYSQIACGIERQISGLGVKLVNVQNMVFECETCGQTWSPILRPNGGKLPRGYWKCPNGCNLSPANWRLTIDPGFGGAKLTLDMGDGKLRVEKMGELRTVGLVKRSAEKSSVPKH